MNFALFAACRSEKIVKIVVSDHADTSVRPIAESVLGISGTKA